MGSTIRLRVNLSTRNLYLNLNARKEYIMASKKIISGILALSLFGGVALAAEQQSTTINEQDLLSIATAGALTSASAGVHRLNAAEMDEVNGGKLKVSVKIRTNPFRVKVRVAWE